MSVLTSNIDRNECRGTVASANQWPDHRYRETRNRRLHKIPDTTGSTSAIRKSDLLVSILLLLVRKSDFLVADELASFSDDPSTSGGPSLAKREGPPPGSLQKQQLF